MNVQTVSLWNLSGVANRGMARLPPEPGALTAAQQVTSTRVDGHIIVLMNRPLLGSVRPMLSVLQARLRTWQNLTLTPPARSAPTPTRPRGLAPSRW